MKRLTILVLALALFAGPVMAKPASKPGKPAIKTQTPKGGSATAGAPKGGPKTQSVKTKAGPAPASAGKSVKAAKTDAKGTGAATKAKADHKLAKADQQTTKKTKGGTSTTSTETSLKSGGTPPSTTTPAEGIDFTATSLGQKLQKNTVQASKIEAKLAAAGFTGTVYEAAYGFKNLGQLNAATNQVQNQGISFELLKVMMTGTYVDPETHQVYRAQRLTDGTVKLVAPELATNPVGALSLGQSKQAIAGGAVMPDIELVEPATTTTGISSASTTASGGRKAKKRTASTTSSSRSF